MMQEYMHSHIDCTYERIGKEVKLVWLKCHNKEVRECVVFKAQMQGKAQKSQQITRVKEYYDGLVKCKG